jgi:hypothetical protein
MADKILQARKSASQKTKRSGCGNKAAPVQTCGRESLGRAQKPSATDDHDDDELDSFFES